MSLAVHARMLDAVSRPVSKLSPIKTAATRLEAKQYAYRAMCNRPILPDALTIGLQEEAVELARDELSAELFAATGMTLDEIGRLAS